MATIVPFRGIRFNPEKAGALAELVTPPYDVINIDQQEAFYRRSPYNIIRLEYGQKYDQDGPSDNCYTRAANFFEKWQAEDVLAKDQDPALYLYQQEFEIKGSTYVRTGFVCGVKIEPYEKGVVLPHEETIPKHKKDRLELMRACHANFSPVFGLFADRDREIDKLLLTAASEHPDIEFEDQDGFWHRMWVISDSDIITRVQDLMQKQQIFIADGHHRYETALAYRNEKNPAGAGDETPKANHYVMMTLVNLYDPGLIILPTHRLVKNAAGAESFLSRVQEIFNIEKLPAAPYQDHPEKIDELLTKRARLEASTANGHGHIFAVYTGNQNLYLFSLKNEIDLDTFIPAAESKTWKQLDVTILQTLLLEKYLGIGSVERAAGDYLGYTRDNHDVFKEVDQGRYQLGIFMNPTMIEEVIQVASQGGKMPQKSTYFYPKLITGLVINEL